MAILDQAGPATRTVRTFCSLCKVICPAVVTVEGSVPIKLEPDREHARGGAVCAKGRAAPEIHDHPNRVNYPLRRTRPKTDSDPGWERCTWDEALDLIAAKLGEIRETSGPQAVAFSRGTGQRHRRPRHRPLVHPPRQPLRHAEHDVHDPRLQLVARRRLLLHLGPRLAADAADGELRLHRALGHQPERDPAWPRPRRDRGTRPGRPAGGRGPAPGRRREQGRPGAPGAPRHGRRPRAGDDRRADPGAACSTSRSCARGPTPRCWSARTPAGCSAQRTWRPSGWQSDGLAAATTPYLALDQTTGRLVAYDAATRSYSQPPEPWRCAARPRSASRTAPASPAGPSSTCSPRPPTPPTPRSPPRSPASRPPRSSRRSA